MGLQVDMIQTNDWHRCRGLATELWRGLELHYGRRVGGGSGLTAAGDRLLKAVGRYEPIVDEEPSVRG
jgi:hypothetical protein